MATFSELLTFLPQSGRRSRVLRLVLHSTTIRRCLHATIMSSTLSRMLRWNNNFGTVQTGRAWKPAAVRKCGCAKHASVAPRNMAKCRSWPSNTDRGHVGRRSNTERTTLFGSRTGHEVVGLDGLVVHLQVAAPPPQGDCSGASCRLQWRRRSSLHSRRNSRDGCCWSSWRLRGTPRRVAPGTSWRPRRTRCHWSTWRHEGHHGRGGRSRTTYASRNSPWRRLRRVTHS
mmetsp:Transcript_39882/g.105801  ORF Transcript_39882/g.105801 Transcript_39882/m.105801 type:complete len:229 (+) Transcript_39882:2224-2910(+)